MTGMPIWYELMTPDPAAAAPFYQAVIGWRFGAAQEMPNGSTYSMIERADGGFAGGVLSLSQDMIDNGARAGWLTYFDVRDVDRSVEEARQAGASVHMTPITMEGVGRIAMIADPQGAPFYLMDPAPPADNPGAQSDVFKPDTPGHCAWNELNTEGAPAQEQFYTRLLGWTIAGEMPMPGGNTYKFLECEGQPIGAIGSMKPQGMPSMWLPYFRVTDIAAAGKAVSDNGGKVMHVPHEVPGGDLIIVATDPAGASVGIVGKKERDDGS